MKKIEDKGSSTQYWINYLLFLTTFRYLRLGYSVISDQARLLLASVTTLAAVFLFFFGPKINKNWQVKITRSWLVPLAILFWYYEASNYYFTYLKLTKEAIFTIAEPLETFALVLMGDQMTDLQAEFKGAPETTEILIFEAKSLLKLIFILLSTTASFILSGYCLEFNSHWTEYSWIYGFAFIWPVAIYSIIKSLAKRTLKVS